MASYDAILLIYLYIIPAINYTTDIEHIGTEMGYTTRPNTQIRDFWPDDTDTTMYIESNSITLNDLIRKAQDKWPGIDLNDIAITSEEIHTQCIGYDMYDPFDYTNFIVLQIHSY